MAGQQGQPKYSFGWPDGRLGGLGPPGQREARPLWHPRQKYNSDKLEMVQRRAARFVKGRYGMFESVTQMLEQLTWTPLSKRRENSRLILFYKIINNLAVVPPYHIHVWKRLMCVPGKNILKSSATSVTTLTHMDNRSFLTVLVRGMALLKTLQRPTL